MSTAISTDTFASYCCCCPSHCPSLIATRRPWLQRLREGLAAIAGRLLAAGRPEPEPVTALDARMRRDIGWCSEVPPVRRHPRELW